MRPAPAPHRGALPRGAERRILGRFYLSDLVRYSLDVVLPFEFVYLYLVLDWSEWAALPLVFESGAFLLLELATGVWADRHGRKRSVLTGSVVSASALAAVPLVAGLHTGAQLAAVCACFMLKGAGETLRTGADEAWAVDNLLAARRSDLIDVYFARVWSFSSAGGVIAGLLALLLLFSLPVNRGLINLLWFVAATAFLASAAVVATLPERNPPFPPEVVGDGHGPIPRRLGMDTDKVTAISGLRLIRRTAGLLALFLAYTIACFSGGTLDEAFDMTLVTRGLDARTLALLGIASDLVGVVAPVAGLALARRLGARRALALLLVVPALIVTVLFTQPSLWIVVVIVVLLDLCDSGWDPLARIELHRSVPSRLRATAASAFEQAAAAAELISLAAFTALIGEQGRALREATPDLVDAFSGGAKPEHPVPTGLFGLPIPDLAIIFFVFCGLLAVPLLLRRTTVQAEAAGMGEETGARAAAAALDQESPDAGIN